MAASDLGLHCLPMSQKWDARLIWVKQGQVLGMKTQDNMFCDQRLDHLTMRFKILVPYPVLLVTPRVNIGCLNSGGLSFMSVMIT